MIKYIPPIPELTKLKAEEIWKDIPFERREDSPRFECWYAEDGRPYTYGRGRGERTYQSVEVRRIPPFRELLRYVWAVLDWKLEESLFNGVFINGYKDGSDHLGWHSDDGPDIRIDCPIAVVSFGAVREIWTRPILDPEDSEMNSHAIVTTYKLEHGSIFVMPANFQQDYQHRIPKASFICGPRISFTFRGLNASILKGQESSKGIKG